MFYQNARIFGPELRFSHGAFGVENGKFCAVLTDDVPGDAIDLEGATVIPGLVEIHSHGAAGADFSDGDLAGLQAMARCLLQCGVTSFAPASMTLPYEALERAFAQAQFMAQQPGTDMAVLRGIHMEGPYFSYHKRGAQNADYLKDPDFEGFRALYESCGGLIRIVDVAPELPGAVEFAEKASKLCTVSAAHTNADYDRAKAFFDAGGSHLTHLFNAMPPIGHREPGVIPAASENENVRAEIICDGYHLHPAAVRMAFSLFPERIVLISDSGRCAGMEEGYRFDLGGQMAELRGGVAKLAGTDTIACSAANLWKCLQNAISWGVPEESALRAATINPAAAIGAEDLVGSIADGKTADFIICSPDYREKRVFLAGKEIKL